MSDGRSSTRRRCSAFAALVTLERQSEPPRRPLSKPNTPCPSPSAPVIGIATKTVNACVAPVFGRLLGRGARLCNTGIASTTAAVTAPAAALSSVQEVCPAVSRRHHRPARPARARHERARATGFAPVWPNALALVGQAFDAARLVSRCSLHSLARVGQLAHLQPALRERLSVHVRHLDVGGRCAVSVGHRVAAGAVVSRVSRLAARRRFVAGVAKHIADVRIAVTD